jgi:hypothetical protein
VAHRVAAALATTLRALTALTELNIDANAIGAQGFAALYSRGPPGLAGLMRYTGGPKSVRHQ